VSRYSKYRPSTAVANARIRADLAVPGGPSRNRCSPATTARAIRSMTSAPADELPFERVGDGRAEAIGDVVGHNLSRSNEQPGTRMTRMPRIYTDQNRSILPSV
jgi:hypothetical protein